MMNGMGNWMGGGMWSWAVVVVIVIVVLVVVTNRSARK